MIASPKPRHAPAGELTVRTERRTQLLDVTARRAILALSPALCGRIAYSPPLPGDRDQLTQRMPMGAVPTSQMASIDVPRPPSQKKATWRSRLWEASSRPTLSR